MTDSKETKLDLTELEQHVLFEKGTEPPFSHLYNTLKDKGVFHCKNCDEILFNSDYKYNSGSGWPSFYQAEIGAIETNIDLSHGMTRSEIICSSCNAHLGHLFDDGPEPTGLRYCVNGSSLVFKESNKK